MLKKKKKKAFMLIWLFWAFSFPFNPMLYILFCIFQLILYFSARKVFVKFGMKQKFKFSPFLSRFFLRSRFVCLLFFWRRFVSRYEIRIRNLYLINGFSHCYVLLFPNQFCFSLGSPSLPAAVLVRIIPLPILQDAQ